MVLDSVSTAGPGLQAADFTLTAPSGFGDGWNQYAHSMAWFRGRLYVGTARGNLAALRLNQPVPRLRPWPVECPERLDQIDRRAQIWAYSPDSGRWRCVYRAPLMPARDGQGEVPHFLSYRGMSVFQGASDAAPCLYVSTWSPMRVGPAELLRSEDGEHFEIVPRPGWSEAVRSFRSLCAFEGRVHTSPISSGTVPGQVSDSLGSDPTIYVSADPRRGGWRPANEPGFGNPRNLTVFELEPFAGQLYAGLVNPDGGELWRTRGGTPPYRWEPVIRGGAGRGALNEAVGALCEFQGALYVGFGILNGGYHRALKIGPAAAELIRVWPDGSWDLVMGDPRVTEQGLKVPLSGLAAGFDNLFNGYVWRMVVHQGWLYAGTFNWTNLLPYLPLAAWPADVRALLARWGEDALLERFGGFELWRSADGVHWEPVTRNGFDNPYAWGIRTLSSTAQGLFVGTVSPLGPRVAVERGGAWTYVDNPRAGCEVWRGQGG